MMTKQKPQGLIPPHQGSVEGMTISKEALELFRQTWDMVELKSPLGLPGLVTPTRLRLPEDLPYEDWLTIGEKLKLMEKAVQWWVGDWLRFGERKYGEMYSQALDVTAYSYQTLNDMKWVASAVDSSLRKENLSWSHHKEVAALPKVEAQRLLAKAETDNLSVRELRSEVQEVKLATNPEKPHVAYNTGDNEWYTPYIYIAGAHSVMGGIDLDPASSELANKTVGAKAFYTAQDDGLVQDWYGRVWLNPPYAGELIGKFCNKLARHITEGDVEQAIVLVNNATETGWFQQLLRLCSAVCFPKSRVRFLDTAGNPGAPLQGQAVLYFGPNADVFVSKFAAFGGTQRWTTQEAKYITLTEIAS